ncbi:MAG: N-6 DNA methylase [Anaerostipes sp.]|jgi:predicted RNA methylase|nr:N-6 DNA methylase [Anaerostipes sp.]MDD3745110.1 N-6 DNA methylase [Anaerostipes sp.]
MKNTDYLSTITKIEKELADWKYFDAIRDRSIVTTIYLIYLKYLSDIHHEIVFERLIKTYKNEGIFDVGVINKLLEIRLTEIDCSDDIAVKYLKDIDFTKMPYEFVKVLEDINNLDFIDETVVSKLVCALILRFSSLYGLHTFREDVSQNDMNLVLCATDLLNVDNNMCIYDCACGTGTLLAMAGATGSVLYGQEEDVERAVVAYILCKMAGAREVHIDVGDVLQKTMSVKYAIDKVDRIISAPPLTDKYVNQQKLHSSDIQSEFLYGDSIPDSGLWIYARHMIQKLKESGTGVMIAPCSLLSREGNTKDDRYRIVRRNSIKAVIQLPTWSSTRAVRLCIIILEKGEESKLFTKIQMIDLSSNKGEKYFLDKSRSNGVKILDSKKLTHFINENIELDGISGLVEIEEIEKHDYNLTPGIYLREITDMIKQRERTVDMLEQQKELLNQYHQSEKELNDAVLNYYQFLGSKQDKENVNE